MPRQERLTSKAARKTRVLEAAERVIMRDGFDGLTLEAAAFELQMSKSAVYAEFATQLALRTAVVSRVAARAREFELDTALPAGLALARISDEFEIAWRLSRRLIPASDNHPPARNVIREVHDGLTDRLTDALWGLVPEAQLPSAVTITRAALEGAYLQALPARDRHRVLATLWPLSAS